MLTLIQMTRDLKTAEDRVRELERDLEMQKNLLREKTNLVTQLRAERERDQRLLNRCRCGRYEEWNRQKREEDCNTDG